MNIVLYDNKAKKVTFNDDIVLGRGDCGKVLKVTDDKCLKVFSDNFAYDSKMFEIMMDLDLANFYKIYDLYYKMNGNLGGYTMKYYLDDRTDILTMPMDYTLDNLMNLSKQIEEISNNRVYVRDLRSGNVIINKENGIIVIDIDLYELNNRMRFEQIRDLNRQNINDLFHQIYLDALCDYHKEMCDNANNFYKLSHIFQENRELKKVYRKLKKYKYPIDLMRK